MHNYDIISCVSNYSFMHFFIKIQTNYLEHHASDPVSKFFLLGSIGFVLYGFASLPQTQHLIASVPEMTEYKKYSKFKIK